MPLKFTAHLSNNDDRYVVEEYCRPHYCKISYQIRPTDGDWETKSELQIHQSDWENLKALVDLFFEHRLSQ